MDDSFVPDPYPVAQSVLPYCCGAVGISFGSEMHMEDTMFSKLFERKFEEDLETNVTKVEGMRGDKLNAFIDAHMPSPTELVNRPYLAAYFAQRGMVNDLLELYAGNVTASMTWRGSLHRNGNIWFVRYEPLLTIAAFSFIQIRRGWLFKRFCGDVKPFEIELPALRFVVIPTLLDFAEWTDNSGWELPESEND